jgi:hypothetical protein
MSDPFDDWKPDDMDGVEWAEHLGFNSPNESLTVTVVPKSLDEFTCVSCFLVYDQDCLDHQSEIGPVCEDCVAW